MLGKSIFKKVAVSALIITSLNFFSCGNFLEGSNLTDELQEEIDYINATEVVVRVAPRTSNHGDMVENGGEVVFKVGYSKTIEFNLKDNYEFIGWAAKDRSSKKEYTDAVEFIPLSEKSSKTQKVIATLLKKVDNLQIMPVCKVINDTVAPEISSDYNFALTPEQLGKQNDMLKKTYSSWNNADYKSHHTKSVWLDFKITESDFEAAENYILYVEEILLKDINGNSPNSITEFKKAGLFTETDTDGTFEIKYEYPFTSGGNGIVQLNIYAMDSEENKSSRITCFVLKDTNIFSTIEMKLTNPEWNTYKQISQNVDKLSFTIKNCFDEYYTSLRTEPEEMTVSIKEENNQITVKQIEHKTETVDANVTLNIKDTSKNYSIKISVQDLAGNTYSQTVSRLAASQNNFTYLYDQAAKALQIINEDDDSLLIYYADFNPAAEENQQKAISHILMENNICTIQNIDLTSADKKLYLISQPVAIGGLAGSDGFLSKTIILSAADVLLKSDSVEEDTPQFSYEYDSCGSGSASYMFTMKLNETDLMMYDSMYAKGGFSADTNSEEITDNYMASTVYGDEVYFTFETKYLAPKFDNDITSSANRNLILILGGISDGEVYETKKVINTKDLKIEDNIPPKVFVAEAENKKNTSERNIVKIRKPIDRSGIEEKNGQCSFDLMYFPEGQSQNSKTITVSYNKSSAEEFITVRLPILTNANYVLMPLVADKKKNEIITESYTHLVNGGYFTTKPSVTYIPSSGENAAVQTVSMDLTGYTQYTDYSFTIEYFNPAQNKWIVKETSSDFTRTGNVLSRSYTDMDGKFIRVSFYAWYSETGSAFGEDAVLIYAQPVVAFAGEGTSYSNNIYEGYGGLTIDCDSPCLVQTYFSEQNNGTSVENWETNCYSNRKINSKYFTSRGIYEINESLITKGCFYVVIACFSDGTKILTNVRQIE